MQTDPVSLDCQKVHLCSPWIHQLAEYCWLSWVVSFQGGQDWWWVIRLPFAIQHPCLKVCLPVSCQSENHFMQPSFKWDLVWLWCMYPSTFQDLQHLVQVAIPRLESLESLASQVHTKQISAGIRSHLAVEPNGVLSLASTCSSDHL